MCLKPIAASQPLQPQEQKPVPVKPAEPQAPAATVSPPPSKDSLASLPSLGTATPVSFVDSLKPGSFSLGPEQLKTKIDLEASPDAKRQKPVKLKAESKLDESLLKFGRGKQQASLKLDGSFKASLDGTGHGETAVFNHEPTGLEGQIALRQDLKGQSGRLKYQSQLFSQQSLTPLFKQQDLPEANFGATAGLSYDSGPAVFGLELREDTQGPDHVKTRLDLKQRDLALSLSFGQESPLTGPASQIYGTQIKLKGAGPLSAYLGGELRSLGAENLKAGLSYASGRTRLSSEAVSSGKDQRFGPTSLTHSLNYQLGKDWDLRLGAKPQAKANEQRLSLGLQGKF